MMDHITAIAHNRIEFTMVEALTASEATHLVLNYEKEGVEATVSKSGRMIVVEADHLEEATPILEKYGFIQDIAHIRHITDYSIEHDDNRIIIEFE